jgi:hypothetical protein
MPPKVCPHHLRRLINEANDQPSGEHPFRQILKAFQAKRQGKSQPSVAVKSASLVTVNLTDYSVRIRSELDLALHEIHLPNLVNLVGECPVASCGHLFWKGRADKKTCDEHVELWRKRKHRRDKKQRETEAKRTHRKEEATKTISQMSPTALAVIRAIMGVSERPRLFWEIDWWVAYEHREGGEVVRSTKVVRQTINKLARDGYLTYSESAESDEDRYEPTPKLVNLWAEIRGGTSIVP